MNKTPVPLLQPEDYQAASARLFAAVAQRLRTALPDARIEHIGASSIDGAISKGDLDLCVLVPASRFDSTRLTLEQLGYRVKPDTLRTSQLCMLVPADDAVEEHAVQLVEQGSRFEFFLHFRDALRADAALVRQYNQIKRDTARLGEQGYRAAKQGFIEQVLGTRSRSN